NVSSGTSPFSYSWSPAGGTNASANNLQAGNYSVLVTDAHGCIASDNILVSQPPVLTAAANATDALCFGSNDGSASVNASGGTSPYNYSWTSGSVTSNANNLSAGNYSVTITDAHGCTRL